MTDEPLQTEQSETPVTTEMVPKEQYFRLAADFENYRKAMEQQLLEVSQYGAKNVVLQMIDVMDHVDQAIGHATDAVKGEVEWWKGMEQIGKQFHDTMQKFGVTRIETTGKPFDPVIMEAVAMVEGGESQAVKEELRAGYTMHERVIRPARVIIYQ